MSNETILQGLTSFGALEAQMQLSCRGIYWLLASPWALARETGVVEREPHANDVWLRLRLWSRLRPQCLQMPIAHARVSLAFFPTQRAGGLQRVVCLDQIPDRVHPSSTSHKSSTSTESPHCYHKKRSRPPQYLPVPDKYADPN